MVSWLVIQFQNKAYKIWLKAQVKDDDVSKILQNWWYYSAQMSTNFLSLASDQYHNEFLADPVLGSSCL